MLNEINGWRAKCRARQIIVCNLYRNREVYKKWSESDVDYEDL